MSVILSTAYLAPIQYYAKLFHSNCCVQDNGENYIKQSYRNRCVIDSPNGALALTIPIHRNNGNKTPIRDIMISRHGNWQHLHQQAFISSYENTPFFEYYADDFLPLFEKNFKYLIDLNREMQLLMCRKIDFEPSIIESAEYVDKTLYKKDFRNTISPKVSYQEDKEFQEVPYYQVFGDRHPFIANLSIADLLFNMGPESLIILQKSLKNEQSSML